MTTYYVSTSGNNSSAGSASAPWRTISHAMQSGLKPGDEVVVRPGTYNESVNIGTGGSAAGDVTLRSEVPGAALIRPPSGTWNAISINDDYVTVEGFDIGGARGDGIEANNVHHISVLNNIAHGNGESGIQFNWSEFITIDGNTTYGNAWSGWFSGISVYQSRNITGDTTTHGFRTIVSNNISYDNVTQGGLHTDGNGIIIDDFQSTQTSGFPNYDYPTLVENNLVYQNGGKGIQVYVTDNVTVRNNTSWHNNLDLQNSGTWRGELSNQDSNNTVWVNNIAVADPTVNGNNTAIGFYGNNSNVVWQNNLTFNGQVGNRSLKLEGGNNPAPTAADGNLLGVDPGFVSAPFDFGLKPGSVAVDAGTGRFGLPAEDLDGGARVVGTVDLGVYELGSSGTAPNPPPNSAPSARDDAGFGTTEGSALNIPGASLLSNDTDPDGDTLSITAVGGAVNGTVSLRNNGDVVFTPSAGATGPAQFDYTIGDGRGGSDTATVRIDITAIPTAPSNAAPVARDDTGFSTNADTALTISAASLLANDTDANGDTLGLVGVSGAFNGTAVLQSNGEVVFTPGVGASGPAQFDYTIADGRGGRDTATVNVFIDAVSDDFSFWNNASTPAIYSDPDTQSVELGMKFLVEVDGEIEALRFFKSATNDGAHSARLWTDAGDLLASVDFTSETSQGWQEVSLANPVQVSANQAYVVSYHSPNGGYSVTENFFDAPLDVGPITALANGGVYAYGAAGSFPVNSYRDSNYWVDVVFDPFDTGTNTGGGAGAGGSSGAISGGSSTAGGSSTGGPSTGGGTIGSVVDAIGEAGTVTFRQSNASQWHSVTFAEDLDNPSVVMGGLTANGGHASTVRLRNVTDTGFEFQLDEWDYLDGSHVTETVSWVAIEAGLHTLSNGMVIEAGSASVSGKVSTVDLAAGAFSNAPVVLAQATTTNQSNAITDRIESVTSSEFRLRLDREENASGLHGFEAVDWIAFDAGGSGDAGLVAGRSGNSVTHKPSTIDFAGDFTNGAYAFITDMQTRNGGDTADVRLISSNATSARAYIGEEQSRDSETNHVAETVGYLGIDLGLIYTDLALG